MRSKGSEILLRVTQALDRRGTAGLLVGADQDDVGANILQGSAYVFLRTGTAWSEQQKLVAADAASGDQFGS